MHRYFFLVLLLVTIISLSSQEAARIGKRSYTEDELNQGFEAYLSYLNIGNISHQDSLALFSQYFKQLIGMYIYNMAIVDSAIQVDEAELEKEISARNSEGKPKIIIGMGTCGIAAGARDILQAVSQEVRKRNLDVITTQTGCIGMCEQEPLIDIQLPGQDRITYGRVTAKDVERIVVEHVINGHVVEGLAIARLEEGGI